MESFYEIHKYLLQHISSPVRRGLMDEIDLNDRLIGIKGSRGVGKTTFLLSYAKEFFGPDDKECLYINMNHFFFTDKTLVNFAGEFLARGGKVLLIDQVFKYPNWSKELHYCYNYYPDLRIVFTGSSVMQLSENPDLSCKVSVYYLRGFSYREYLNLMSDNQFPAYPLEEILNNHAAIAKEICSKIKPRVYFQDYLQHGCYPFFLEKRNFSENLLKTMNMTLEVDVLFLKQIEHNYLSKLRKLLYLMSLTLPCSPNVSRLSKAIKTSRATVMNYIKYLQEARLISLLYEKGEEYSKKPAKVYMHNTNLIHVIHQMRTDELAVCETFFCYQLLKDNIVNTGGKTAQFLINGNHFFQIMVEPNSKAPSDIYHVAEKLDIGEGHLIPLWLFGFLY